MIWNWTSPRFPLTKRINQGLGLVTIDATNLDVETIRWRYSNGSTWTEMRGDDDTPRYVSVTGADIGETFYVEIWGTAVKSDKDVKITATLGVYNYDAENDQWVNGGNALSFFNKSGDEYTIFDEGTKFTVCEGTTKDNDNYVSFYVNSKGQVQMGQVMYDTKLYTIVDAYGEMNYAPENGGNLITGDIYRDVNAFLNDVLDAMGFEYGGRAYITRSLIMDNLGTVVEGSDSLVYPTGYVQQLVTNDPSVKPPQTGDNASVVGFVMIAVALVAAAAVTVKKVRA